MSQPSVVIIGAGVTGLAAASTLADAGWQVTLLDKARNAGGRCATRRIAKAADSPWFDFGAQYFTARHPDFIRHSQQALNQGQLQHWRPDIACWQDGDIQASNDEQIRLVGTAGLSGWLKQQANELAALPNLNLHNQQQVSALEFSQERRTWTARTAQGQHFKAQHLIVTAPPEQTRMLCAESAAELTSRIHTFASAACWSVVMRTAATPPYQALFFKDHPSLNWAANNASKYSSKHLPQTTAANAGQGLWTLHANPAWSAQHVDTDPSTVAQQLINDFMACFPAATSASQSIQTPPEAVHTHRWLYARPTEDSAATTGNDAPFIYQQQQQIGLAGDWLAGGRVEGAWVSGNALAKQLLA